jgi:hypothetical protein
VTLLLTEGRTEDLRVGGGRGAVTVAVLKSEMDRVERRLAGEEAADADERLTTTLRGDVGGGIIEDRDDWDLVDREERAGEACEAIGGVGADSLSEADGAPKSSSGN